MFDSVFKTLESLVLEFSWRRLFVLLLLALIVPAALATFEWYTGYFALGRLERATALLER